MNLLFLLLPKLALKTSSGSVVKFLILLAQLWYFSLSRKFFLRDRKFNLVFYFNGKKIRMFVWNNSDISALLEIFVGEEYEAKFLRSPGAIIDLGAHTGNTAIYFNALYPEAVIYAVEPSPKNFERLKLNVNHIKNIIPVFGAVSGKDGEIEFFESESSLGSSLSRRSEADNALLVPTFTLSSLYERFGIHRADFVKIDIEGGEEFLFLKNPEEYSRSYIIEIHFDLIKTAKEIFLEKFKSMEIKNERVISPHRILLTVVDRE